jgi:hypothetical protein
MRLPNITGLPVSKDFYFFNNITTDGRIFKLFYTAEMRGSVVVVRIDQAYNSGRGVFPLPLRIPT